MNRSTGQTCACLCCSTNTFEGSTLECQLSLQGVTISPLAMWCAQAVHSSTAC
jgi:hypothetical protein